LSEGGFCRKVFYMGGGIRSYINEHLLGGGILLSAGEIRKKKKKPSSKRGLLQRHPEKAPSDMLSPKPAVFSPEPGKQRNLCGKAKLLAGKGLRCS